MLIELLPRTDAGVAMQVTALTLALAVGLWLTRGRTSGGSAAAMGVGAMIHLVNGALPGQVPASRA